MTVKITVTLDKTRLPPGAEQRWAEFLSLTAEKKSEREIALRFGDRWLPVKDLKVMARPENWLRRFVKVIWHNEVYDRSEPHAEGIKATLQILTGIMFAAFLAYQIVTDLGKVSLENTADHALKTVGAALAVSAVIELAYTFFTRGPDEALDPLILGLSSFILIKISAKDVHLTTAIAQPVSLLALAIVILFFARRFLCEVEKEEKVTPHERDQTQQSNPLTPSQAPPSF